MELIARDARKHGIADDDMLHAYRNAIHGWDLDDEMTMIIGPDQAGRLLEVGYLTPDDSDVVIVHAMPARRKYTR